MGSAVVAVVDDDTDTVDDEGMSPDCADCADCCDCCDCCGCCDEEGYLDADSSALCL